MLKIFILYIFNMLLVIPLKEYKHFKIIDRIAKVKKEQWIQD